MKSDLPSSECGNKWRPSTHGKDWYSNWTYHIYRSTNECTNYIARSGAEQEEDMVFVMEMSIDMREFVIMDGLNIRQVLD